MNIKKIIPAIVLSGAALALTACGSSAPNVSGSLTKFCKDQLSVGVSMEAQLDGGEPVSADDYKAVEGTLRHLAAQAPVTVRSDVVTMANAAKKASLAHRERIHRLRPGQRNRRSNQRLHFDELSVSRFNLAHRRPNARSLQDGAGIRRGRFPCSNELRSGRSDRLDEIDDRLGTTVRRSSWRTDRG